MDPALIAGLTSGDEEAIAAFGESGNCVVVDWRDGPEEILDAATPFLPKDYLTFTRSGDTQWIIQAGGRSAQTVEYGQDAKQEEFFVALNRVLAPEYELRQYKPVDGDGYSLYLAPAEWWQFLADTHPTMLEKYFLSAERLEAYMKKSYLLRLFCKP